MPIYGICLVSLRRRFFTDYYLWYVTVTMLIAGVFFLQGVGILMHRHGVLGTLHWIKGNGRESTRDGTPPKKSSSANDLKRLSRLLLIYLSIAVINMAFKAANGGYIVLSLSDWHRQIAEHHHCVTFWCPIEKCPSLPRFSIFLFISHFITSFLSATALTSWAFTRRRLINVPLVGSLFRWKYSTEKLEQHSSKKQTAVQPYDTVEIHYHILEDKQ